VGFSFPSSGCNGPPDHVSCALWQLPRSALKCSKLNTTVLGGHKALRGSNEVTGMKRYDLADIPLPDARTTCPLLPKVNLHSEPFLKCQQHSPILTQADLQRGNLGSTATADPSGKVPVPQTAFTGGPASTIFGAGPSVASRSRQQQIQRPSVHDQASTSQVHLPSNAQPPDPASAEAASSVQTDGAAVAPEILAQGDQATNYACSRDGAKILAANSCAPAQKLHEATLCMGRMIILFALLDACCNNRSMLTAVQCLQRAVCD
jgi:hypothetical protein